MKLVILFALVISGLLLSQSVFAQQDSLRKTEEAEFNEILKFVYQLPPLEGLVQRALEVSALIKSREGVIKVKENELLRIKNDWLDILTFQGNVGYGNGLLGINQSNLSTDVVTNTNSVRFSIGVAVNLSPSYIRLEQIP